MNDLSRDLRERRQRTAKVRGCLGCVFVLGLFICWGYVEFIADPGANWSRLDHDLSYAVQYGTDAEVKSALQRGARPNVRVSYGWRRTMAPALFYAVKRPENLNKVRILLDAGADPHVRINGSTGEALARAAQSGSAEMVRLLLKHGADAASLKTAIAAAQEGGNRESEALLRQSSASLK